MIKTSLMTKTSLAVLILLAATGLAQAQAPDDGPTAAASTHPVSGPDGTVGAMRSFVQGVATSPDDVAAQQEGRSTAADGARPLDERPALSAAGAAPGTVGAAPGNDRPR